MADTMTLAGSRDYLLAMHDGYECVSPEFSDTVYKRMADAIDAAIKQRERGANNPLKGWIFDKVNMGRGDERYICTPDGANATTVRNESTSDHRERLLWLIADAMAKESGNG